MSIWMVFRRSIKHLNFRGYMYVWANLLWVALTVPIITVPASWAGMMTFAYRSHTQARVSLDDYWDGFRKYFWQSMINAIISAPILIINVTNAFAFSASPDLFSRMLSAFWVFIILVWIGIQFYVWAIMEEMEIPNLLGAYRNAFIMVLKNPLITSLLVCINVFIFGFGLVIIPLTVLLTASVIAILSVATTLRNFEDAGYVNTDHIEPIEFSKAE